MRRIRSEKEQQQKQENQQRKRAAIHQNLQDKLDKFWKKKNEVLRSTTSERNLLLFGQEEIRSSSSKPLLLPSAREDPQRAVVIPETSIIEARRDQQPATEKAHATAIGGARRKLRHKEPELTEEERELLKKEQEALRLKELKMEQMKIKLGILSIKEKKQRLLDQNIEKLSSRIEKDRSQFLVQHRTPSGRPENSSSPSQNAFQGYQSLIQKIPLDRLTFSKNIPFQNQIEQRRSQQAPSRNTSQQGSRIIFSSFHQQQQNSPGSRPVQSQRVLRRPLHLQLQS